MEEQTTKTYSATIKKLPESRIEIVVSLEAKTFDATRQNAITRIGADVELPGFRKGHIPEKILLGRIGEAALLEEMAEIAIGKVYPKIIIDNKLDVLGRPEVSISKIAHGNPLEFTITTAVFPEFTLPDYKAIATKEGAEKINVIVSDEDIEKTISQIRRMRAQQEAEIKGEPLDEDATLPEIDDAYVAKLGAFKTVDELKEKLKENILSEKTREAKDKKRVAIMEAIVSATSIELPEVIISQEIMRMEDEFTADVARMGINFDEYLKKINKSKEEMQKDWRPDAIKRATIQILVGRIADAEKIDPDHALVEKEAKALRERYPDAPEDRIHSYIHMLLTNEKVFEFLESL